MQKVNLYNGALLPKPEALPLLSLMLLIGVVVIFTSGYGFVKWSENNNKQTEYNSILTQKSNLQLQLNQLQSVVVSEEEKIIIERKINRMQNQLDQQHRTLALIQKLNSNQLNGYFGLFENLTEIKKKKLWLTRIRMDADKLNLEGKTYESSSVANMVDQLQEFEHTKQVSFKKVTIERKTEKDRIANFSLFADREGIAQ